MADQVKVTIDDAQVSAVFRRLVAAGSDLTPVMAEIAEILAGVVEDAFASQADPATGQKWADLSPTRIKQREESGSWPGRLLQVSGQLAASVDAQHGADFAIVGSNKVYAGTMHFGAKKGEFGTTSRGAPIPWGDIPARPIFGLSPAGREDILEAAMRHIENAI